MSVRKRHFSNRFRAGERSAALIAVLGVVVFLTVIIVSLIMTMQFESEAASNYKARALAQLLAWEGVENVKASLMTAMSVSNTWVSTPGEIYYWTNSSMIAVPLHSGTNVDTNAASSVYQAPDLNRIVVSGDGLRAITGTTAADEAMYVGWVYVHQSGLQETNQTPNLVSTDPIIGRFAYWADDESSRIDLNTAWGSTANTNWASHPSRVGLSNIFGSSLADTIHATATNTPFHSPDEAGRLNPDIASLISSNRFSLTHATFSPNLNPWGQPKIVLTTQAGIAQASGSTNYLNILTTPNSDPANINNINYANLTSTLTNLITLLSNQWPYLSTNASFAQKYYVQGNGSTRIGTTQLALDIIDYVRSAETTNTIVQLLRGGWVGNAFNNSIVDTTGFVGTGRHPVLRQMGVWITNTPTLNNSYITNGYIMKVVAGLYCPPNYHISSCPISNTNIGIIVQWGTTTARVPSGTNSLISDLIIPSGSDISVLPGSADPMTSGSYCVVSASFQLGFTTIPKTMPMRVGFYQSSNLWEIAPAGSGTDVTVPVIQSATPPAFGDQMPLAEVSDPRINKSSNAWITNIDYLGKPTLGMTSTNVSPPQDTDASGNIYANSLYMPPPKNQGVNTNGLVSSIAELGYVTTGAESAKLGVPWRTLRLQPTSGANALPPDWALLDLFTAPLSTNNPTLYQPQTNTTAGRININSAQPFVNNTNVFRLLPLASLFQSATNLTVTASNAAANISSMNLAANGTNYGIPAYASPGELAEVKGIADGGEASEANLQGVVDLLTARGAVFRVYSVGQAIKQTPGGQLVVQSEQYREAIVRGYNPAWTNSTTLLWKNILQ